MAEHAVDNRAVEGSSPSGCIEFVGRRCKLLTRSVCIKIFGERWPVRVWYALFVVYGSVAKWLMQRPVASPIEGSSPFTPVKDR